MHQVAAWTTTWKILNTYNGIDMLHNLITGYFGIVLKQLADRFVDFSQNFLIPASIPLGQGCIVGGCHCVYGYTLDNAIKVYS